MKIFFITTLIIGVLLTWYMAPLFLLQPSVWPDEAVYADIARNIHEKGYASTSIWGDMLVNAKERAMLYPPVMFYSIAGWTKIFGTSIISQRMLSLFVGILILPLIYALTSLLIKQTTKLQSRMVQIYATIATSSIMIDFLFLRSAIVSRPEIFILFFSIVSLYLFAQSETTINKQHRLWFILGSGLAAGLSALVHPAGIWPIAVFGLYFLFKYRQRIIFYPYPYIVLFTALIPISIWVLTTVLPFWDTYVAQMVQHVELKRGTPYWILQVFTTNESLITQITYVLYIAVTIIFWGIAIYKRRSWDIFLACILLLSWFVFITGRSFWYTAFPIPFVYVALAVLLARLHTKENISYRPFELSQVYGAVAAILIGLIISNVSIHVLLKKSESESNHSYTKYTEQILNHIPDNTTVFMSAIPDPYYGFTAKERQNRLYEFPMWPAAREAYIDVLNKSDYIIFNGMYEPLYFGTLLRDYINKNAKEITTIGKKGEYQAYIITLKSLEQRVTPR